MRDAFAPDAARLHRIAAWTEALCGIPGLSGHEDPVRAYVETAIAGPGRRAARRCARQPDPDGSRGPIRALPAS